MLAGERKETESTIPQDFLTGSDTERTSELPLSPRYLRCSFFLRIKLKVRMERSRRVSPGGMVDEGLGLVLGKLVGLELVDGGYSGPVVLSGSACSGGGRGDREGVGRGRGKADIQSTLLKSGGSRQIRAGSVMSVTKATCQG